MGKHAYLIIAHNNWEQLQFLLDLLDDPRNDFFLLIDAKAHDFDKESFIKSCPVKRIYFADPIGIYWGDYTQILAELSLIKLAHSTGKYDYYHLVSAVDMPLRSQEDIHRFFEDNKGCEFVDYDSFESTSWAKERLQTYYYFQKLIGRRRHDPIKLLRDLLVRIQRAFGVNRVKDIEAYLGKGANWFSITGDFAGYIVENEQFIHEHFKQTYCADEVFIQTMLKMSPYRDNWYGFKDKDVQYQNLRLTDWNRGKPYTFKKDEYFDLCDSSYLFARKFGSDIMSEDVISYLKDGGNVQ